MSIRASRNINLADVSSNPAALILGSIFTTPDTFDTFVGTGSGVKRLAYGGGAVSSLAITSATPSTIRNIDSEVTLSATTITISGSVVGVLGQVTIAVGSTVEPGSFIYGTQGKIVLKGTIAGDGANTACGLKGQLDLTAATAISSGNVACAWLDCGVSCAIASPSTVNILQMDNTTSKLINSVIYAVADASYLFDFSDLAFGGKHFIVTGAVGGSQDKKLKCKIDGTTYYIPLNTA